jgi:hypothetical protein
MSARMPGHGERSLCGPRTIREETGRGSHAGLELDSDNMQQGRERRHALLGMPHDPSFLPGDAVPSQAFHLHTHTNESSPDLCVPAPHTWFPATGLSFPYRTSIFQSYPTSHTPSFPSCHPSYPTPSLLLPCSRPPSLPSLSCRTCLPTTPSTSHPNHAK